MTFQQKLDAIVAKNNSLLCIGLDPDIDKLPEVVKNEQFPQFAFNKSIIDATHDLVCAYKPNSAFYEAFGSEGIRALKMTCDYLYETYPEIPIILDAKRADIGSTNKGYVSYAFEYLQADAITLHPYLGREALQPFLDQKDKGCIILCRTSNPGAGEFQDINVILGSEVTPGSDSGQRQNDKHQSEPLYKVVARQVVNEWNINGNCMLVVGATYPKELAEVRKIVGDMTLLVPGIGVQGGNIEQSMRAGLNSQKKGIVFNTARSVIFASSGPDYIEKAKEEALRLKEAINKFIN